ncbi:hypothetical protein RHSIM_Rhsim06G0121200 [Rhododendron simsii]|uniref:Uncharacterized protein n=1 Tax=Rhododendron simsii TaxID=118357 RepID=A0A834GT25_RHOSS|nr:hypothetical protein RHSIM_Rhsim06G0121200 [Rhododendron simsii]
MAVAFQGFSIREYVSKTRSVDVAKCWPFDGETDEGFLPPITVAKFRWWSDELGLVRLKSEEREMVFGESSRSRGDAGEVGLSEEIGFDCKGNDERSHVKMKAKSRAPKKRSIVEIFAVAPQEKPHKLKLQSRMVFSSKPNSSFCIEGLAKGIPDAVSIREKKPTVKCLATQKKKLGKPSKLVKHKKSGFHVRGILKNHKKGFVGGHSTLCNSQIAGQFSQYSTPQSDRHVRFSDMNDIRGPRSKPPPSQCPKWQSVSSSNSNAFSAASTKDHETERGKNLTIAEVNESEEEDVSISSNNETEVQVKPSSTRKLFDTQNFLKPPMGHEEHFSKGSVTVNQVAPNNENFGTFNQGYRDSSHDPSYDCSLRFPSLLKQRYDPVVHTEVRADIVRPSNCMSDGLIESHSTDLIHTAAAAACSLEYVKSSSRPSPSSFAMNGNENGKLPFPPQTTNVTYPNHAMQYQSFCHFTPKELMRSISTFPDWKQRAAMGEGKCLDQGFFGLPLNSQGELIPLNSSGTITGSSYLALPNFTLRNNGGALTKDQINVFPVCSSMKGNLNFPITSRTGQSSIQGTAVHCFDPARESNQSVYDLASDLELVKNNYIHYGHKQYNQVQTEIGDGKGFQQGNPNDVAIHVSQPTMRLMGKEFTVGRSSQDLQAFEDGKIWTDKQIIAEHRPSNTAIGCSSLERPLPGSGKLKENVPYLSEFHIYQASQNGLLMKPPASMFSHPYHTYGSRVSTLHPYIPSSASPPLYSPAPLFQDSFTIGYESSKANPQIQMFASTPQGYMSHMTSKSADLQNRQKLPHATKSAMELPFLNPDSGEHVQPSWLRNPPTSLPPWLINATQQKETPIGSFHSYLDVGVGNHASTTYGSNFQPYPHNPAFSDSAVKNSLGLPLMPLCREFIPIASVGKNHGGRMKFKERVSPRVSGHRKNIRKRPAARSSSDSLKPTKIPNLTVEEGSGAEKPVNGTMAAVEQVSIRDKPSSTECGETEIRTTDDIEKSGPIRLSAGAKHILKPSSDMNQDNSRATFSSIPFAAVTSSGRASEPEMKSAQIYRILVYYSWAVQFKANAELFMSRVCICNTCKLPKSC